MAKRRIDKTAVEIRGLLADNKLIIGTERTLKLLRLGKLKQVFLSANCADSTKEDILHYSNIAGVKVKDLAYPGSELGVVCKKPYSISVIGVLK
ncbi:ribosomal L7Ae/L30e/S12e/Gadd45 family protein [Candidatus Woesearchaeota archaeon]|nr:ribosomal L7Ae/L30e/S12e/Gadd45 family protein [Candidatus Woesearchaeota archaeon]MBW3005564.1 ribosomal L7Ae/L30e/S12e/Gadd45 family protein [Candidatus Woesearchaeota archaeon]